MDLEHIRENYKIKWSNVEKDDIVDCSKYLPKYWGKFICMKNTESFSGLQNGMGLHSMDRSANDKNYIVGVGCFEIRYNEDRILVFTDLRYYYDHINKAAYLYWGEYYEYAYPHWGIKIGIFWNTMWGNDPNIPEFQIMKDLYPLGK